MKKLLYLSILLVLVLGTFTAASAQVPEKPSIPPPDKISPTAPNNGVQSLSGSFAVFDPSVGGDAFFVPGMQQTFCFRSETFTTDWGYVSTEWEQFPPDWQILNAWVLASPAPVCTSGAGWGAFSYTLLAPNHLQINHWRYQATNDHCIAYYCAEVISGSGAPDALVDWGFNGDDYGSPPYHPCSTGTYNPPGITCDERIYPPKVIPPGTLDPFYMTPPVIEAQGCCCQWQDHTLTLANWMDYDMDIQLTYTILQGVGEVNGPPVVHVPAMTSTQFLVQVHPFCDPNNLLVVQVQAFDPVSGWGQISTIIKHLVQSYWADAWLLENNAGAIPQQWGSCAANEDDGMGYYVGGLDSAGGVHGALQQNDPVTSTWTQLPPMPQNLFGTVSGWLDNGKLYVAGGLDAGFLGYTSLWIWDGVAWTPGPPMLAPRGGGQGGESDCYQQTDGNCLIVAGGTPSGTFTDFSYNVYEYNADTGIWTPMASIPGDPANYGTALGGGTMCDDKLYIGGDYRGVNDFFAYDTFAGTWAQLADIPAAAGKMTPAMACKEVENALYLIGGDSVGYWGDLYNNKVFKYDIAANTWTQMPQTINQGLLGSCALYMPPDFGGGKLYTFGGTNGSYAISPAPHESLQEYDCQPCITCHKHLYRTKINGMWAARPGYVKVVFLGIVHDQDDFLNPGATVYGHSTLPNGSMLPLQAVTDALGRFKLKWKGPGTPGPYTITVDDITEPGCVYDPGANHLPQGDPVRTVIIQ